MSNYREKLLKVVDPPNGFKEQLVNAGIMAGFNFFGTLVGLGATGLLGDITVGLLSAGISAGFAFFGSLVAQRGLQPKKEETK